MKKLILIYLTCIQFLSFAQIPVYVNDIPVTINGLTFDAMEPFISADGNALFFNSLNDGINTSLYYAGKVNDSTFNLVGAVPIVNQPSPPHLDAVASLDTANNFYWISTRNYPADFDNVHRIRFLTSGYTNFGRVLGNFYIYAPGWLIMDAAINYSGDQLYYCNARFNSSCYGGGAPCRSAIGIAKKVNDSTFNKISNSGTLLANVNDTSNYIVYAPQLSKDGLELYYTRLLIGSYDTEVCVSVRADSSSAFGVPSVLISAPGSFVEAATITTDKTKLYYHKKVGSQYKIFLKNRVAATSIASEDFLDEIKLFPNPVNSVLKIELNEKKYFGSELKVIDVLGKVIMETKVTGSITEIEIENLNKGCYYIQIKNKEGLFNKSFLKN